MFISLRCDSRGIPAHGAQSIVFLERHHHENDSATTDDTRVHCSADPARRCLAQSNGAVPSEITTPGKVETRIGTLEFKDGAPSKATLDKIYDDIDFAHAQRAFADTFQGVSLHAIGKGLRSVGVKDNEAIIFS